MFKTKLFRNRSKPPPRRSSTATSTSTSSSGYGVEHLIDDLERADRGNFVAELMLQPLGWNGSTIRMQGCIIQLLHKLIDCQAFRAAQTLVQECNVRKDDTSDALLKLCADFYILSDVDVAQKMTLVDVLLDHGACTEYHQDARGRTALHVCFENKVARRFLNHIAVNANVNARNSEGNAVLHLALEVADVETVRILLRQGANANLLDSHGHLPLVLAALHETDDACLSLLLRHGAQPELLDVHGEAARLCIKSPEVALPLFQRGFRSDQTDAQGVAPIHTAFGQWCTGSSVANRNDEFMALLFQGEKSLTQWLLEQASSRVNLRDDKHRTPLHCACQVNHAATFSFVQALVVTKGADVNVADVTGWTPLHSALGCGNYTTAVLLMQLGGNVQAVDALGRTPFHVADTLANTFTTSESAAQLVDVCLHAGFDFRCVDHAGNLPFATVRDDTLHFALVHAAACQGLFR